jgi:DNA-binding IclR family transcriptional regulator
MPLSSSEAIAERAGLNERYVREWLGAMATGDIVEVDDSGQRFRLPDSRAAMLTEGARVNAWLTWLSTFPLWVALKTRSSIAFNVVAEFPIRSILAFTR